MTFTSTTAHSDLLLVGGGLQNALIALAALAEHPERCVTLIEQAPRLGGNHTWCFHQADVPNHARRFVDPLVVRRWSSYEVKFPSRLRHLQHEYSLVTSEQLHLVVLNAFEDKPNARLVQGEAVAVQADRVRLSSGQTLTAELVVDSRGPERGQVPVGSRFQKFVGLELEISPDSESSPAPWVNDVPVLMDATVPQTDGFRFFYVLPISRTRVLVEDTYYSDDPELDRNALRDQIISYARAHIAERFHVVREESGVLPLPTRSLICPSVSSPLLAGYAGGFFHPTTGYSFPAAVRLACHIAQRLGKDVFDEEYHQLVRAHQKQARYALWLNRLLFNAFAPEQRLNVLQRFYGLPEDTIQRFYALQSSPQDRLRVLCGRPPQGFSATQLISRSLVPGKIAV